MGLPQLGAGSQEWNVSKCPRMSQLERQGRLVHACARDVEKRTRLDKAAASGLRDASAEPVVSLPKDSA